MASEESDEYKFYDIIVRVFERLITNLKANNFQEVKNELGEFIKEIEHNSEYINSTPNIQSIIQFAKTASNVQDLRRSLGAGIGEGYKNKKLIRKEQATKLSNRRAPVRPRSRPSSQPSSRPRDVAYDRPSPNYRVDIASPQRVEAQTPNVRIDVSSPQPTEAGEAPEEIKLTEERPREHRYEHPPYERIPESAFPSEPERLLQHIGTQTLQTGLRAITNGNRHPGQRISLFNIFTHATAFLGGVATNYGPKLVYSVYDYLTEHPEIQAKVEKEIEEESKVEPIRHSQQGIASKQASEASVITDTPLTNPYEHRPELPRGLPHNYRASTRYTGNYKFPLGAYNYVEFDKFARNNTIRSLT